MSGTDLRLERLDDSNWRRALEVRPKPEQLTFVADYEPVVLVILSKCDRRAGGLTWEPFGILAGGKTVGVCALAHSAASSKLFHFLIDRDCQGRGYGRAAMTAIIEKLRRERPACKELVLTVHPRNAPAQRLYASLGFRDTGESLEGEPVWRLALGR